MNGRHAIPGENPFCTRRIRPGALPFLFSPGIDLETLLVRLQTNGNRGEIVGPHGSGKSTLLAAMIPALQAAGWQTQLIELHDGQRRLPAKFGERGERKGKRGEGRGERSKRIGDGEQRTGGTEDSPASSIASLHVPGSMPLMLLIDGYEQLGFSSRFLLKRRCRRKGWGLVITSHRSGVLPPLFETGVTLELANRVIQEILGENAGVVSQQEISDSFVRHEGNLREVFFDLYDLLELHYLNNSHKPAR
jgi:hypothetical protein